MHDGGKIEQRALEAPSPSSSQIHFIGCALPAQKFNTPHLALGVFRASQVWSHQALVIAMVGARANLHSSVFEMKFLEKVPLPSLVAQMKIPSLSLRSLG
mmetsp:Transcript_43560/g.108370  ORF Transcript_43560/g.108370 Transcript_43560/m.108370 type:complete len:100 (+) Transcript_43560:201-500(+)